MTQHISVLIKQLDPELSLPTYAHADDAGADLISVKNLTLHPGERALVPTGIAIAVPMGYAAFVHPRSGLAARCGISMVNAPGTIDAGYRGEVLVNLINLDPRTVAHIARGDRIAQLVIQPVAHAEFMPVDQLPESTRGTGGHGSTGVH